MDFDNLVCKGWHIVFCFVFIVSCGIKPETKQILNQDIFAPFLRTEWYSTSDHWRWENDVLVGETTEENPLDKNSFFIWENEVKNFTLSIFFRISEFGNSGIYYRCEPGPAGYDALIGYQADIDGQHHYTGIIYENFMDRHREILVGRGQFVGVSEVDSIHIQSSISGTDRRGFINDSGWNKYELYVKDHTIVQKINGYVMSILEDRADVRNKSGLFGFQLHSGPPMKVEFKDAVFRELE